MTAQMPDGSQVDVVGHEHQPNRQVHPMRVEIATFLALMVFFVIVGVVYAAVADAEPVGTVALLGLGGMNGFFGVYLWLTARKTDAAARYEDDPNAEIADRAGDIGDFSPGSWMPLVLGFGAALGFLGVAAGWYLTGLGFIIALVGLVGQMYEFNRGIHKH